MKRALPVLFVIGCHGGRPAPEPKPAPTALDVAIVRGRVVVEAFFGVPVGPFATHTFARHDELAAFARDTWQMPELPCWAVAMGTGTTLAVLDPGVWMTEACDHADAHDLLDIVAHELVHVFHGQHRPDDPELDLAGDLAWFVEGLAVYASGQLDEERRAQAEDAAWPTRLADAWSGPARYAIAGRLAEIVHQRVGDDGLIALLTASTTEAILAAVGLTEAELLVLR